jgi:hypothetical protein
MIDLPVIQSRQDRARRVLDECKVSIKHKQRLLGFFRASFKIVVTDESDLDISIIKQAIKKLESEYRPKDDSLKECHSLADKLFSILALSYIGDITISVSGSGETGVTVHYPSTRPHLSISI